MISNYSDILAFAKEHKVTIGAFNTFNMEMMQAVVAAADKRCNNDRNNTDRNDTANHHFRN